MNMKKTSKYYKKNPESYEKKKKYDKEYNARPEQKKNRASRNAARREAISSGRAKKGDGKDVDHKNNNPRDNTKKNLRVVSAKKNRAHGMTGYKKPKTAKRK